MAGVTREEIRSQWAYERINEDKKVYAMHNTAKVYPKKSRPCNIYAETQFMYNGDLKGCWDGTQWKLDDLKWQEAINKEHAVVVLWCYNKEGTNE